MFKGRIGIWIAVFIICFIGHLLIVNVPKWFYVTNVSASFEVKDNSLPQYTIHKTFNGYKIVTNGESDIIFSDSSESKEGYNLEKEFLTSPLVCYLVYNVSNHKEGVILDNGTYKIDLCSVLTTMENNKNWEDLGFHKNVLNGTVNITIPNERCWYYSYVENLFYITLNNGQDITDEQRQQLKPRVDALLSKCNKVSDIGQAIYQEYNDPSKTHKMFIGPEFLFKQNSSSNGMGTNSTNAFIPVYMMNTKYISINAYIKTDDAGVTNAFVDKIQSKKEFTRDTGWRVKDAKYDIRDISKLFASFP